MHFELLTEVNKFKMLQYCWSSDQKKIVIKLILIRLKQLVSIILRLTMTIPKTNLRNSSIQEVEYRY